MRKSAKSPPRRREPGKGRYIPRKKVCSFCVNKVKTIDYKDVALLRRYISDRGRIDARRKTGVCARHQRILSAAMKRARHIALLPYTPEHVRQSGGPRPKELIPKELIPKELIPKELGPEEPGPEEPSPEEPGPEEPGPEEPGPKEPGPKEPSPEEPSPEEPGPKEQSD